MPFRSQERATHGAAMLDSNSARFALWAPDAQRVDVEFASGRREVLRHRLTVGSSAGSRAAPVAVIAIASTAS